MSERRYNTYSERKSTSVNDRRGGGPSATRRVLDRTDTSVHDHVSALGNILKICRQGPRSLALGWNIVENRLDNLRSALDECAAQNLSRPDRLVIAGYALSQVEIFEQEGGVNVADLNSLKGRCELLIR